MRLFMLLALCLTHDGIAAKPIRAKTLFNLKYVKTGKISLDWANYIPISLTVDKEGITMVFMILKKKQRYVFIVNRWNLLKK